MIAFSASSSSVAATLSLSPATKKHKKYNEKQKKTNKNTKYATKNTRKNATLTEYQKYRNGATVFIIAMGNFYANICLSGLGISQRKVQAEVQ